MPLATEAARDQNRSRKSRLTLVAKSLRPQARTHPRLEALETFLVRSAQIGVMPTVTAQL